MKGRESRKDIFEKDHWDVVRIGRKKRNLNSLGQSIFVSLVCPKRGNRYRDFFVPRKEFFHHFKINTLAFAWDAGESSGVFIMENQGWPRSFLTLARCFRRQSEGKTALCSVGF